MKHIARCAIVEHAAPAMYALVELRLLAGPFRHFAAHWRFTALGERAARIDFAMEYEFAGALVTSALGPLFETIADTMVDAFKRRADAVYGQAER